MQQVAKVAMIENLSILYKDWFNTKEAEETNLQKKWIEKHFSFVKSTRINFECVLSMSKVQFPVMFSKCIDQKTNLPDHFEQYIDLVQLLTYYLDDEGNFQKQISCPSCKKNITFPSNLDNFAILQHIVRPHIFILKLRQQVGIFPKEIIYHYPQDLIIPTYKGKYQEYMNAQEATQYSLTPIILQQPQKDKQFFEIANQLQDFQGTEFTNVCLISQIRVNIPVRGTKCVHYETYDLAALHKYLNEKCKSKSMKCNLNYCESEFNLNDPSSFCIDFELLKAGREGLSFSINFCYNPNYKILSDVLLNKQEDVQISKYRSISDQTKNFSYLHRIYELSETIFANEKNKTLTDKFYENFTMTTQDADLNLFMCTITSLGIQLPARCRNCKDIKICDLRFFACILNQVKNSDDVEGVSKVMLCCPLCQSKFVEKPKPPLKFIDQVYIDAEMMKFFLQYPFYNRTLENFQIFLQRDKFPVEKFKEQLKTLQEEEWIATKNLSMYMLNLSVNFFLFQCLFTGSQLEIPVRSKACQIHYDCFDLESLISSLDKNPNISAYRCPKCQCPFESIDNLFIDKVLYSILKKQKEVVKFFKRGAVNLTTLKIQEVQ